ncbi:MAG: TetR/AcrR family transcriptional regulator [Candidatus Lindowbacteria bacterium]|nr:TetR/AcrR family transcriptional regulator [Candidatus Lindowbacteria bacterium]
MKAVRKFTRRENERLRRIELVLDAAEELFLKEGFAAATMQEIGELAEFSRATLYHYFRSKEAIYVAILERAMDALIAEARESTAGASGAVRKIEDLKDAMLSFLERRKNAFHLYFISRSQALPYLDEKLAKRLQKKTREFEEIFHDIYREGVKQDELKPADPLAMGDIFFAQIIGLMLLNSTEKLEPPLRANVDKATSFFLGNITTHRKQEVNKKRGKQP